MMLVDVNLLLDAANPHYREHSQAKAWWESKLNGVDLVTDAYLAALAIDHDCELNSTDEDFMEFTGLRWRNPLTGAASPTA